MIEFLSFIGHHIIMSAQIEFTRYLIGASGVAILYWLIRRTIEARRIQTLQATFADRRREFRLSFETVCVFAFVNLLAVAMIHFGLIHVAKGAPILAVLVPQVIAMVILHDAWFYWMHRTLHLRQLFRLAHAAHHRSRTPTSWAAYSFAPVEAIFESIYVPVMLLGISWIAPIQPWAVFIFLGHQIARNALGHSGFELAWPGFTRSRWTGWMTTTVHHDLHHQEGRYNFGLYFTWWDRWMGTEHPRYHERFDAVTRRAQAGEATSPRGAEVPA